MTVNVALTRIIQIKYIFHKKCHNEFPFNSVLSIVNVNPRKVKIIGWNDRFRDVDCHSYHERGVHRRYVKKNINNMHQKKKRGFMFVKATSGCLFRAICSES